MAGKPKADQPVAGDEAEPKRVRKFSLATVLVVAVVLLMEGGTVLLMMMLSRGPAAASADSGGATVSVAAPTAGGEDVEELIVEGKATNIKRGVTFVYRYKIHAVVGKQDLATVKDTLDKRRATIEDTVRQVIARLEPKDLDEEPGLETLRRVLNHEFEQIFGAGRIKDLLVPEWTRFRGDY